MTTPVKWMMKHGEEQMAYLLRLITGSAMRMDEVSTAEARGRASQSLGTLKSRSTCELWLRESCYPGHHVSHESASMAALA